MPKKQQTAGSNAKDTSAPDSPPQDRFTVRDTEEALSYIKSIGYLLSSAVEDTNNIEELTMVGLLVMDLAEAGKARLHA